MRRMERGSLGGSGSAKAVQGSKEGQEGEAGAAAERGASEHRGVCQLVGPSGPLVAGHRARSTAQGTSPAIREAFPSARQRRCAGLKRSYYPDYVREFVDYDYDESLPDEA